MAAPPPAYNADDGYTSPAAAAPPQSYPAPQGYAGPPQGYAGPPQGYAGPPQQGYAPPQQGYAPPPQGYAMQPQGYPGQYPPQGGAQVVVAYQAPLFTHSPQQCVCPHCGFNGITVVRHEADGCTWAWCIGLFCFTGVCCCLPFCIDSCQSTVHTCSHCQRVIAVTPS